MGRRAGSSPCRSAGTLRAAVRGSNAFQERLFVVAMFFYSLSSLRVPCGRPNTFSRFVGSRLVAQPLIAVVRFCWGFGQSVVIIRLGVHESFRGFVRGFEIAAALRAG